MAREQEGLEAHLLVCLSGRGVVGGRPRQGALCIGRPGRGALRRWRAVVPRPRWVTRGRRPEEGLTRGRVVARWHGGGGFAAAWGQLLLQVHAWQCVEAA